MIVLGSGDPTRAICSSFIAKTFQSIHYPILPNIFFEQGKNSQNKAFYNEVLQIRHHSLYVPRDFDLSPYFNIVKPTLNEEFDPHTLEWSEHKQG